jgi:hypothetical protein
LETDINRGFYNGTHTHKKLVKRSFNKKKNYLRARPQIQELW